MISVYVQKTLAAAKSDTPLTSGSVGTVVQFYFSGDWDGLNRTAVFETSAYQKETTELDADNSAVIPESVMAQDGVTLFIGVYGTNEGGSVVVPTVYANCGEIKTGANTEPGGEPVTPSQAQQLQNQIDDLDNRVDALEAGGGGGSGGGAVTSVNGQTGAVVLNATDVGALPDTTPIPTVPSALPNPNKLTFTGAVSAEYDGSAPVSVEIPSGGGVGESEWRYIGEFTAADNINPFIIDADADGNPFACREFRILGSLAFFQLSSNPTANRDIGFRGDDGRWYAVHITNIQTAMFPLTKADSVDGVEFDTGRIPVTMDFNSHGGILIMECANESLNNVGGVLLADSMRNRGVVHAADKFTAVRVSLGYATNLVVAGSWLKIWGR